MPEIVVRYILTPADRTETTLDAATTTRVRDAMAEAGSRTPGGAHHWESLAAGITASSVEHFPPCARLWHDLNVREMVDGNAYRAADAACLAMRNAGRDVAAQALGVTRIFGFAFGITPQQTTDLDPRRVLGAGRQFLVDRLTRRLTEGEAWAAAALVQIAPFLDDA